MQDTSLGSQWSFTTTADDQFQIRKNGAGTTVMAMRAKGAIAFGFGGFTNFTMLPNGSANLRGTLQQNSDRNSKKDIVLVDPETTPTSSWKGQAGSFRMPTSGLKP